MQKRLYWDAKEALLHSNIASFGNDCGTVNISLHKLQIYEKAIKPSFNAGLSRVKREDDSIFI